MKLAFACDMHGNLDAFRAVVAEIDRRGPFDGVYGGGDIALGGLNPGGCVQMFIDRGWESVRGNAEELVLNAAGISLTKDDWPAGIEENPLLQDMAAWTVERLTSAQIDYMNALPLSFDFTGPSGQTLLFVHATPWSVFPIVWHDADLAEKREMVVRAGTDALLYAHIHHAYQQDIDGKTLCCAGSVGLPYDGDQRACFTIATDEGEGWRFEHVRVAYDYEAYAQQLEGSDLPGAEKDAIYIRNASMVTT